MEKSSLFLLAMMGLLLAPISCGGDLKDSSTSILTVIPDDDYFQLIACAPDGGYSLEQTYNWRSTSYIALVTIDFAEGTTGSVHVRVNDAIGQLVYEDAFTSLGQDSRSCAYEETAAGVPGLWSAYVQIIDLKGSVAVIVERR